MTIYAIVGASRGIGLEYVRQLAARPEATVFALVRNASSSTYLTEAIAGLKNVHVLEADIVDHQALERAAGQVSDITGGRLDVLIHNAAKTNGPTIMHRLDDFSSVDALDEDLIAAYKVNTLGVIHSIKAFLPLLRASTDPLKKIVVIGSPAGDLNFMLRTKNPFLAAYSITKAGAHMVATKYALTLKDEGFVVVSLSPGAVDTSDTSPFDDSKKEGARVMLRKIVEDINAAGYHSEVYTPERSVATQIKTIDGLTQAQTGLFLKQTGEEWKS